MSDKPMCPHCHKRPALLRMTDNDNRPSSSAPCCHNIACIRSAAVWCLPMDVEVEEAPCP